MPNYSPQTAEAVKKFEKAISKWSKAPMNVRKSVGKTLKSVENSVAAFAAATAGAVPSGRIRKGGKRSTRRMTRRKSKN